MKNKTKYLSVILCISLLLSSFSLIAFAQVDEIELFSTKYKYVSDIGADGVTLISKATDPVGDPDSDDGNYESGIGYECYGIKADKAGLYSVTWDNPLFGPVCVSDTVKDGVSYGRIEMEECINDSENKIGIFFHMDEGDYRYVFFDEWEKGSAKVNFQYVGDIKSVASANTLYKDADCYFDDGYWTLYPYLKVSFTEGAEYVIRSYCEAIKAPEDSTSIKTNVVVLEKKYEITITIGSSDGEIKSIALPKDFEPSCTVTYAGYYHDEKYPEYITITLKDGTTKNYKLNEAVVLDNGRVYYVYCQYIVKDGKIFLEYGVSGIKTDSASVKLNKTGVGAAIKEAFGDYSSNLKFGLTIIFKGYEDWTKEEGFALIFSFARIFKNLASYIVSSNPTVNYQ